MDSYLLIPYITSLVAFITAFIGVIFQVLALRDSITLREKRQRIIWMLYFCSLFVAWLYFFLQIGLPQSAVFTGAPFVLAILCVPVFLFHAVYLTASETPGRFSLLNYFVPVAYFLIYCIWTPLVPGEIRNSFLYAGNTFVYKTFPGYEAYCIFTGSITVMRGILSAIYGSLSIWWVLRRYRRSESGKFTCGRLVVYILLVSIPLINGLLTALAPLGEITGLYIMALTSLLIIGQMITILCLLFGFTIPVKENPERVIQEIKPKIPLTRELFEEYYIHSKRYLDPDVRLTDLLKPLQTNRTTFSGFINKTYGMSFSRLTARYRLREMDRLMNLPENKDNNIAALVTKAGFTNEAAYYLARRIERKAVSGDQVQSKSKKK